MQSTNSTAQADPLVIKRNLEMGFDMLATAQLDRCLYSIYIGPAIEFFKKAADLGSPDAKILLQNFYLKEGLSNREKWYDELFSGKNIYSENQYFLMAKNNLLLAIRYGNIQASFALGHVHETKSRFSIGRDADTHLEVAQNLFSDALEGGYEDAKFMLRYIARTKERKVIDYSKRQTFPLTQRMLVPTIKIPDILTNWNDDSLTQTITCFAARYFHGFNGYWETLPKIIFIDELHANLEEQPMISKKRIERQALPIYISIAIWCFFVYARSKSDTISLDPTPANINRFTQNIFKAIKKDFPNLTLSDRSIESKIKLEIEKIRSKPDV